MLGKILFEFSGHFHQKLKLLLIELIHFRVFVIRRKLLYLAIIWNIYWRIKYKFKYFKKKFYQKKTVIALGKNKLIEI